MKGGEFLRKVQKFARKKNVRCVFVPGRGKGSHGTPYYDSAFTVVKDRNNEIGPGLFRDMCRDLGIDHREL
jgi:hypothetical protein